MTFWDGEWSDQVWQEVDENHRWWQFWKPKVITLHLHWKEGASIPTGLHRPGYSWQRVK